MMERAISYRVEMTREEANQLAAELSVLRSRGQCPGALNDLRVSLSNVMTEPPEAGEVAAVPAQMADPEEGHQDPLEEDRR